MVNALVDEQAVAEMALCTDLFDHIDDLLNFPGDDIIDDSDFPNPVDDDADPFFASHSSAAADDQLLGATAINQDDHTKLGSCDDVELAELDWLSNFLDDSSAVDRLTVPSAAAGNTGKMKKKISTSNNSNSISSKGEESLFRTPSPVSVLEHSSLPAGGRGSRGSSTSTTPSTSSSSSSSSSFSLHTANIGPFARATLNCHPPPPEPLIIPGRARTKRPRPAAFSPRTTVQQQVFIIPNLAPAIEPEAVPLATVTTTTNSDPESFGEHDPAMEATVKKNSNKKKKNPSTKIELSLLHGVSERMEEEAEAAKAAGQTVRKCMHCEITKTPQWRAGPMGPKTLCNACGVRYKSGRLFPEYRPAASPTFLPSVHSNSHKKVVEMRIKASQIATAAGMPVPDNPAAKGCDLLQFIRRRE